MSTPDSPYTMHGADVPAPGADLHGPDALAEARAEVERIQRALTSSHAQNARIQAEGNALADRLHEQDARLQAWREACRQYGIPEDPDALLEALRGVEVEP